MERKMQHNPWFKRDRLPACRSDGPLLPALNAQVSATVENVRSQ